MKLCVELVDGPCSTAIRSSHDINDGDNEDYDEEQPPDNNCHEDGRRHMDARVIQKL
jgi:hypothetical protein